MLGQLVNWDYQWSQIVGRAWADDNFKHRLLANPASTLAEYELAPPVGLRIEVLDAPVGVPESTSEVQYLVLPVKPSDEELSEEDLCSVDDESAPRRYCGWCGRCGRCHCGWCGCHHPPKPEPR